jgi:LPXTG-motif cell wall-anchored protein
MRTKGKRLIRSLIGVVTAAALCLGNLGTPTKVTAAAGNIWIVGDSTVSSFTDSYYYPRYGWGTQIGNYLDGSFTIQNLALSGRSSKSYTVEPQYQTLLTGMTSGDYLLVGFGHNDEKTEVERYTNPNGTYLDAGSFANSLYENYIRPAQAAGTNVILCTPIVRRTATGAWSDSLLHITATSGDYEGGDYAKAIRDLGTALNIPVVDMTTLTKNLYDQLGPDETLNLHAWTSSKPESVDNTHTNIWGAKYNAYLITKSIKEAGVSGLAQHVIEAAAPTKADSLVSNPDYKEPTYSGELTQSTLWSDHGIWKGTVFGDVGGNPSTTNQTLETDSNGNMHIAVANNKGKIASTVDGIAMYYYKVPASSTFTLTAKAKINRFDLNDQVTFGLMARDAMYIDYNTKDALGDYVAAAPYKLTKAGAGGFWNCFARKSGVLTQGGTAANPISAGDTVNLSIASNSDGYAAAFGNEATITGGFDFQLTSIDSNYVYVGMFVARNADITFSDVKLVVDGVEVSAAVPTVDKTELQAATANAQAKYDAAIVGTEAGQYPEAAKTALQTAIATAQAVIDNASATADEVSQAAADLNAAVATFDAAVIVQAPVDKTKLNAEITAAQAKYDAAVVGTEAGQYPEAAKTALQTAIATAQAVIDDASATADEVSQAVASLNAAVATFDAAIVTSVEVPAASDEAPATSGETLAASNADTVTKLPKTGSFMDTKILLFIGGMFSVLGAAMFVVGRKKNKATM